MILLYALLAVLALILLIARFKVHPFVALVLVSLAMGAAARMTPGALVKAFQDGVGATLGSIAVVVGLGTMLGKMMAESGAAARIATTLIGWFGERRVHWALMFVACIVGIPVFFQVGFVLLIPLVFASARRPRSPGRFSPHGSRRASRCRPIIRWRSSSRGARRRSSQLRCRASVCRSS